MHHLLALGAMIGTCFSLVVSGLLCAHVSWDWAFYLMGIIGFAWSFGFAYFCFDSPETHPRISDASVRFAFFPAMS